MTDLKITILGCGNSTGVPAIGNYWGSCDPNEPKNRRTRSSIAVQSNEKTIIIDTGPDFRNQLNRENIQDVDAALLTHMHGDHVNGIDELRVVRFRRDKLVDVYMNQETYDDVASRFPYVFKGGADIKLYPPILKANIFKSNDFGVRNTISDINFTPFEQDHGTCVSIGYRFGNFAYSLDMLKLDDNAIKQLVGIDTWIVDAAGYKNEKNFAHASLQEVFELNEKIGAKRVILSSLSLSMDYQTLINELPDGYEPAYDGLTFTAKS